MADKPIITGAIENLVGQMLPDFDLFLFAIFRAFIIILARLDI